MWPSHLRALNPILEDIRYLQIEFSPRIVEVNLKALISSK